MEINTIKEFNYKGFDQLLDPNKDLRAMVEDPAWGEG